jgi:hypothetical protein
VRLSSKSLEGAGRVVAARNFAEKAIRNVGRMEMVWVFS